MCIVFGRRAFHRRVVESEKSIYRIFSIGYMYIEVLYHWDLTNIYLYIHGGRRIRFIGAAHTFALCDDRKTVFWGADMYSTHFATIRLTNIYIAGGVLCRI